MCLFCARYCKNHSFEDDPFSANAYGSAALREVVTTVPKEIEYELVGEEEDDCASLIFNMDAVKIETDIDEPQKKVPRI